MEEQDDERKQRELALLALRLTEEVLAFVEAARSPHLDWPVIARHLAPHHHPALSPRECRALWRKLAYRNSQSTNGSGNRGTDHASKQSDDEEARHDDDHDSAGEGGEVPISPLLLSPERPHLLTVVQARGEGGKAGRGRKRRSKDGDASSDAVADAASKRRDEKRPRLSASPASASNTSTTTTTTAGPADAEDDIIPPQGARAGGRANPLGTPHPEPPAVDRESGDAQQKAPRKRTMWTNEEDVLLLRGVQRNGEGNWAAILRDQLEGSLLLRRNSTQLAQRWNAIKRKIQRAHYAGLDEATKTLAMELVSAQQTPPPPGQREPANGGVVPSSPEARSEGDELPPPTEQPFRQPFSGPSRVFD